MPLKTEIPELKSRVIKTRALLLDLHRQANNVETLLLSDLRSDLEEINRAEPSNHRKTAHEIAAVQTALLRDARRDYHRFAIALATVNL